MRVASQNLRTKVTAKEQTGHEIYLLNCKIKESKEQIDFFTQILNNPKASIEIQRKMLFNIESEELKISIYNQLKNII